MVGAVGRESLRRCGRVAWQGQRGFIPPWRCARGEGYDPRGPARHPGLHPPLTPPAPVALAATVAHIRPWPHMPPWPRCHRLHPHSPAPSAAKQPTRPVTAAISATDRPIPRMRLTLLPASPVSRSFLEAVPHNTAGETVPGPHRLPMQHREPEKELWPIIRQPHRPTQAHLITVPRLADSWLGSRLWWGRPRRDADRTRP